MSNKRLWKKVLAIDMLMLGVSFSISSVGQMFNSIKTEYQLTLPQASILLSAQSIGGFIVAIMCILFIDSLNKSKFIILCGIMLSISLILVGIKLSIFLVYVVFIMLGLFTGFVNTLTNAVMAETVPTNSEKYINFMHMIFSFGAVIVPILSSNLYIHLGLPGVFIILGGFSMLWAVYALIAFSTSIKSKLVVKTVNIKYQFDTMREVIRIPGIKEVGVIAMLTACWQLSAIYYISFLFSDYTGSNEMGAFALSVFFLGMMLTRLIYAKVANRYSPGRVIAFGCLLCVLSWTTCMLVNNLVIKMILIGLSAFFLGNNFPINFSTACKLSPNNTAAALGIAFLGYYLALFIFVPIVGTVAEATSLKIALILNSIPIIILIPVALRLHRIILKYVTIETL